ncbi:hypothetical protein BV497_13445, partial [Fulvimonas soli]
MGEKDDIVEGGLRVAQDDGLEGTGSEGARTATARSPRLAALATRPFQTVILRNPQAPLYNIVLFTHRFESDMKPDIHPNYRPVVF